MLSDRRFYHMSVHAYSRTKLEEYLDIIPIATRRRNAPLLKTLKSNYKVVDRSVYLQAAATWNNMNIETRNIDNLEGFKAVQKKLLLDSVPLVIN